MAHDRSRSGPAGTTGARAGAGGLRPDADDGAEAPPVEQAGDAVGQGEQPAPLPLEPGREYVDKVDHERIVGQLTRERDEYRADLQRIAADFENFRRRAARDREQAAAAADAKLLGELLAVIDDMERALQHAEEAQAEHPNLAAGIRMVHDRLDGVLRSHGLEPVEVDGTFDPNLHEAMMLQPTPGVDDGTIVKVLQSGWKLGDRVLRHARVIVAGGD